MPNAAEHRLGACLVTTIIALLDKRDYQSLHKLIFAGGLGYSLGTLPDLIEPALSPHHRKLFHSWFVLALVGYGVYKVWNWKTETETQKWQRIALIACGSAYLTHLLMDSGTPKGLPVL